MKEDVSLLETRVSTLESMMTRGAQHEQFRGVWKQGDHSSRTQSGYKIEAKGETTLLVSNYNFWTRVTEEEQIVATRVAEGTYKLTISGKTFFLGASGVQLVGWMDGKEAFRLSRANPENEHAWAASRKLA